MFNPKRTPPAMTDDYERDSAIYQAAKVIEALIPITFVLILICFAIT